eukprot:535517_1
MSHLLFFILVATDFIGISKSAQCSPVQECTNYNGEISCHSGANCTIDCNAVTDCTDVTCHENSICNVNCNAASACQNTMFNATDAAKLTITTTGNAAAYNSIFYCPNRAGGISCILRSEDKESASQFSGVAIYSIEGFYTVSINCSATDCANPGGITLFCGQNEDQECIIDISSPGQYNKCQSSGPSAHYCEHPPTYQPITKSPTTQLPTISVPTTSVPTTSMPTTSVPTTLVPTTSVPTTTPFYADNCELIGLFLTLRWNTTASNMSLYSLVVNNPFELNAIISSNVYNHYNQTHNLYLQMNYLYKYQYALIMNVSYNITNCNMLIQLLSQYFISTIFMHSLQNDINTKYYSNTSDNYANIQTTKSVQYHSLLPKPVDPMIIFDLNNPVTITLIFILSTFLLILLISFLHSK